MSPNVALVKMRAQYHLRASDVPDRQSLVHRHIQALMILMAQNSACNRKHPIDERCAPALHHA
jgi:hypothetical protein